MTASSRRRQPFGLRKPGDSEILGCPPPPRDQRFSLSQDLSRSRNPCTLTPNPIPGNQLEALKGKRKGQHSIRINDQWRVCFVWSAEGPKNVEIVDYH
ncbi:MAG: type II toxin-antitoxin system RelE/ParE family toxin [Propionivibrio sp.]|uniref:type II toxin-antitoxin system RelE/ParE family toxin n=1 Tax=Propionivibrio sp. TaxID=2212460 RepID=UPI001A576B3F|nr:type II toxin-antitoxin system RelE/ParE family toxin [Propionivibrio sp.]MBL8414365.1 type II toxin-antitoxin system RelE/ParE family toxin [Propionivibrio sp.]